MTDKKSEITLLDLLQTHRSGYICDCCHVKHKMVVKCDTCKIGPIYNYYSLNKGRHD